MLELDEGMSAELPVLPSRTVGTAGAGDNRASNGSLGSDGGGVIGFARDAAAAFATISMSFGVTVRDCAVDGRLLSDFSTTGSAASALFCIAGSWLDVWCAGFRKEEKDEVAIFARAANAADEGAAFWLVGGGALGGACTGFGTEEEGDTTSVKAGRGACGLC